MSPIRPDQRKRYPKDWPEISLRIRFERAGGRCECRGECGHNHDKKIVGGPIPPPGTHTTDTDPAEWIDDRCAALHGLPHPVTRSNVVLTVAHLDHTPENCSDKNLRAMCQRCHLAYDRGEHAKTRAARSAKGGAA